MIQEKQSWIESLLVYKDIRMLRILLLGAISGFPWVLIASSLSLWLKEEGLSRSAIGWAGLILAVVARWLLACASGFHVSPALQAPKKHPQPEGCLKKGRA